MTGRNSAVAKAATFARRGFRLACSRRAPRRGRQGRWPAAVEGGRADPHLALRRPQRAAARRAAGEARGRRRERRALRARSRRGLAADAPAELKQLRAALADATARGRCATILSRSQPPTAPPSRRSARRLRGDDGEPRPRRGRKARQWLLIRDFRQATRFTRPGVDATTALDELESGDLSPADAVTQIRKDLLDAYQARLVEYLDEASTESDRASTPPSPSPPRRPPATGACSPPSTRSSAEPRPARRPTASSRRFPD